LREAAIMAWPYHIVLLTSLMMASAPEQPRPTLTRDVEDQGYRVRLDLGPQVLSVLIPEDRGYGNSQGAQEAPISPTLAGGRGKLVSASMLAQKAKQFDDGLYAAVELAAQHGAGPFAGKEALLRDVAARLISVTDAQDESNAATVLLAACRIGKLPVQIPAALESVVALEEKAFLADPLRSKPLGFYTWSAALSDIYRQDRMLQTELKDAGGIMRLAAAITADPGSKSTYEAYLTLNDRLTNPHGSLDGLRGALRAIEAGRSSDIPRRGMAVFPASRSHEADLVMKLYGGRPIPEGFSLVDEMIRRIRSGQIDLKPTESSGWYDYQTWALEPLVIPERMPEAKRLEFNEKYRKQLLELFKGVLALTRETHVKQLEIPAPGAAAPFGGKPPVRIHINPDLTAEPLVTYYRRRAESYAFLHKWLTTTFGAAGLKTCHRQTATGPVAVDLGTELESMRALFSGASAATARQLGMPSDTKPGADEAAFHTWARDADKDADVGRDARMMVPVFYDILRKKTKVWAFLGWSNRPVIIGFAKPPTHEVFQNGRKLDAKNSPEVVFTSSFQSLAYPVTAEVYVDKLLDRDEFRKLCDTYKTRAAILGQLTK
jgi:hypothetical protein